MAGIFRKTPKEKLPETVESSLLACLFGFSSNAHWLVSHRVCGSSFLHELPSSRPNKQTATVKMQRKQRRKALNSPL